MAKTYRPSAPEPDGLCSSASATVTWLAWRFPRPIPSGFNRRAGPTTA